MTTCDSNSETPIDPRQALYYTAIVCRSCGRFVNSDWDEIREGQTDTQSEERDGDRGGKKTYSWEIQ